MSKVSWYKQRLKALLFKARFADKVEDIKPVRNGLSFLVSCPRAVSVKQAPCQTLGREVVCFVIGGEVWRTYLVVRN